METGWECSSCKNGKYSCIENKGGLFQWKEMKDMK